MAPNPNDRFEFGPFELHGDDRLLRDGRPVALTPKEAAVMRALVEAEGRVVSKDELLDRAWPGEDVSESSLTSCMHTLRNQLGDGRTKDDCIGTVYGRGYRLTLAVRRTASAVRLLVPSPRPAAEGADDGWCERLGFELIEHLTRHAVRGLAVIAPETARGNGEDPRPAAAAAREVGAGFVLGGRLARREGRLALAVALAAVRDGEQLLVRTFERREEESKALVADVADAVLARLPLAPAGRRDPRLVEPARTEPRVYEAYLEARVVFRGRTPDRLPRVMALYEQAIAWDRGFAPAYVGLADCLVATVFNSLAVADEVRPRIESLLDEAAAIDPATPGLAVVRASVASAFDWDFAAAEPVFRSSLEHGAADTTGLVFYARHLVGAGLPERSAEVLRSAIDLDPLQAQLWGLRGYGLFCARRFDEALASVRRGVELEPTAISLAYQAVVAAHLGRRDEALGSARRLLAEAGGVPIMAATAALALASVGEEAPARRSLEDAASDPRWPVPSILALVAAALGDADAAAGWLERALAAHCVWLPMIRTDPGLDRLRGDRRVRAVFEGIRPRERSARLPGSGVGSGAGART